MSAYRTSGERMQSCVGIAGRLPAFCALFVLGFAGCGHKAAKFHIPVTYPVPIDNTTATTDDEIEPVPPPDIAPLQWPEPPKPPVRRRPPAPSDASVPTPPGSDTAPDLNIGTLTMGGDANPRSLQQARDLIASVDRRAMSLPPRVVNGEKPQLRQVRNYLDKAKQALNTGDAEGAVNLANRAQQLLDELERR